MGRVVNLILATKYVLCVLEAEKEYCSGSHCTVHTTDPCSLLRRLRAVGSGSDYPSRHAFIALDWEKDGTLLLGQTWHPMNDLYPSTVGIALGSPFNPLNRSPQFRGDGFLDKNQKVKLTVAAIFQAMNTSTGPVGKTNEYNRNSMQPMVYAGMDFYLGDLKLGAGVEYQDML